VRLDASTIISAARLWSDPWVGEHVLELLRGLVMRLVEAYNNAVDEALFSVDPTALERLGTLIAEHAIRREVETTAISPELRRSLVTGNRIADLESRLARTEYFIREILKLKESPWVDLVNAGKIFEDWKGK